MVYGVWFMVLKTPGCDAVKRSLYLWGGVWFECDFVLKNKNMYF